jgi:hypothetical protein
VALRALQHAYLGVEGGLAARGPQGCPRRGNGKSGVNFLNEMQVVYLRSNREARGGIWGRLGEISGKC